MDERLQYDIEEAVHKIGVLNDKHNIGLTEKEIIEVVEYHIPKSNKK